MPRQMKPMPNGTCSSFHAFRFAIRRSTTTATGMAKLTIVTGRLRNPRPLENASPARNFVNQCATHSEQQHWHQAWDTKPDARNEHQRVAGRILRREDRRNEHV